MWKDRDTGILCECFFLFLPNYLGKLCKYIKQEKSKSFDRETQTKIELPVEGKTK